MKPTDSLLIFGLVLTGVGALGAFLCGSVGLAALAGLGALACLTGFGLAGLGALLGVILYHDA